MLNRSFFPFKSVRPEQSHIMDLIDANSKKKYFIIEAGTGIGKSPLAITLAQQKGENTGVIITDSLQLQDQYLNDFSKESLINLKGRTQYECTQEDCNCEEAPCRTNGTLKMECIKARSCPYYNSRIDAQEKNIVLNSYALFLSYATMQSSDIDNYGTIDNSTPSLAWLSTRRNIVFDEAHLIEKHLVSQWSAQFNAKHLDDDYQILRCCDPEQNKILRKDVTELFIPGTRIISYPSIKEYTEALYKVCKKRYSELESEAEKARSSGREEDAKILSKFENFQRFTIAFYAFYEHFYDDNGREMPFTAYCDKDSIRRGEIDPLWTCMIKHNYIRNSKGDILEEFDEIVIKPIKVDWAFMDKTLKFLPDYSKIYFLSATILDQREFCNTLGIPLEETCFIQEPSPFDPNNSPIVMLANCKTDYNSLQDKQNMETIGKTVKSLLSMYPNEKGIIHTGNSRISLFLKSYLNDSRLLVREGWITNKDIYNEHLNTKKPTVLVSSSMSEGVDLKDDLGRFQIIIKMPFESLADERTSKLAEKGDWYLCETFKKLIQQCGRATRHYDDKSITIILDNKFPYWLEKAKSKSWLTDQFLQRIKTPQEMAGKR